MNRVRTRSVSLQPQGEIRRDAIFAVVLSAFVAVGVADCGATTHDPTNSNTNWLRSCRRDADCGAGVSCLCGVCTRGCGASSECSAAATACVATGDPTLVPSCGGESVPAKICAAPCSEDATCHAMRADLTCNGGICSALASSGAATTIRASATPPECAATCDTPAGTVKELTSIVQFYGAMLGSWQLCLQNGDPFGAPADTVGIEFAAAKTPPTASATNVSGALYFLVNGATGPQRGQGFDYQWTYQIAGQDSPLALYVHPTPNSGNNETVRYSPCPRELEIVGGSATFGRSAVLVPIVSNAQSLPTVNLGSGGSSGGGGGQGGGDAAGAAGSVSIAAWPSCVADMFAACPLSDSECTHARDDGAGVDNYCFTSGSRVSIRKSVDCGSCGCPMVTEVRKADGSLCYTKTTGGDTAKACQYRKDTWQSPSGEIIAFFTRYSDMLGSGFTCTGTGVPPECNSYCYLPLEAFTPASCSEGACP
jgi:hypothetical protein